MALQKTELIYNGTTVKYHRVISYHVDLATGAAGCVLGSWASTEDRAANKPPVLKRRFAFVPSADDLPTLAYAAIKENPIFSDAEDV